MIRIGQLDITLEVIDDKKATIKFYISQKWTIDNFLEFFNSINILYKYLFWTHNAFKAAQNYISNPENKKLVFNSLETPLSKILQPIILEIHNIEITSNDRPYHYKRRMFYGKIEMSYSGLLNDDTLNIQKISYASPGVTDIIGISGILKELKELITYYIPNKKDKEKAELLKQQRIEIQINNLKTIGLNDIEIRRLIFKEEENLEIFVKLFNQGLIEKIELT